MSTRTHPRISHVELEALCISAHEQNSAHASPWTSLTASDRHKFRGQMLELLLESQDQWPNLEHPSAPQPEQLDPTVSSGFELLTAALEDLLRSTRDPQPGVAWIDLYRRRMHAVEKIIAEQGL